MNKNQKGLSSILFAMVFAVILSLLAVGFATLLRNDSRQVVDQTLSYQAQYAAETGVNQAIEFINNGATEENDCQSFNVDGAGDAEVTCVIWGKAPNVEFSNVGESPESFQLKTGGSNISYIDFTLGMDTASGVYPDTTIKLPDINQANFPILKITLLPESSTNEGIVYVVPIDSATGTGDYADGALHGSSCTSTECTFRLNNLPADADGGYMSVSTIGQPAYSLKLVANVPFDGVQWAIDSTAIAQDVTKRVYARVDTIGGTWRPGFVAAADEICKDIKVDGNNNSGISTDNTCVNRLITPVP